MFNEKRGKRSATLDLSRQQCDSLLKMRTTGCAKHTPSPASIESLFVFLLATRCLFFGRLGRIVFLERRMQPGSVS